MHRLKLLLIGALAFIALHATLVSTWQTWFGGGNGFPAWFMNSTAAVGFAVAVFAAVGLVVALFSRPPSVEQTRGAVLALAIGGAAPMIVVLFTMRGGPGNLFPIATVIGFSLLLIGSAIGTCAGWWIRRAFGERIGGR